MRGLALGGLLLCGLTALLVYAATSGLGMRSTSFVPVTYAPIESKPQKMVDQGPVVEVESKAATAESLMPKMPAPEVKVRVERRRKRPALTPKVAAEKLAAVPTEKAGPPTPQVKAKKQVVKAVEPPKPEPEIQKAPEPVIHPNDVSDDGPMSQLEADRKWRRETLARWRREGQDRRDGGMSSTVTKSRPGDEPSLRGTPVEGLFPADGKGNADQAKKKKKRHRILFIRW